MKNIKKSNIDARYLISNGFVEVVKRNLLSNPDKLAINCENKNFYNLKLSGYVDKLSFYLDQAGIKKGDTIAVILPNCVEYAPIILSILQVGAICVPLNPKLKRSQYKTMLEDCGARAALVDNLALKKINPIIAKMDKLKILISIDDSPNYKFDNLIVKNINDIFKIKKYNPIKNRTTKNDIAFYMYTSGTTGEPKGVMQTYETIIHSICRLQGLVNSRDICYTIGGMHHNGKLFPGLMASLVFGMPYYTDKEFYPDKVISKIINKRITFFHANPFHFGVLGHWKKINKGKIAIRFCLSTGNRVDKQLNIRFQDKFGIKIMENYGITEVGGVCLDRKPYPGVKIKIINKKNNTLKKGELGEIIVSKRGMAKGYLRKNKLSKRVFKNGWYHTDDIGVIGDNGELEIIGRKKNSVLFKTKVIYPDEIERILISYKGVINARVQINSKGQLEAKIFTNHKINKIELQKYCRKYLATYKVPQIKIVNKMSPAWIDTMEKIEREALPINVNKFLQTIS